MVQFKSRLHISPLRIFLGTKKGRTIANNTVAMALMTFDGDFNIVPSKSIGIDYHGNRIAEINDWNVYISNCGYGTPTTRTRINSVLADNHIPYRVTQKNHSQILSTRIPVYNDMNQISHYVWTVIDSDFHSGNFVMDAGVWVYNKR
jgi:hypothetical protein